MGVASFCRSHAGPGDAEAATATLAGDIPLVGNLFKNKDDEIARTELIIAITPHIVNDEQQTGAIAAEFRDRLNLIRVLGGRRSRSQGAVRPTCAVAGSSI